MSWRTEIRSAVKQGLATHGEFSLVKEPESIDTDTSKQPSSFRRLTEALKSQGYSIAASFIAGRFSKRKTVRSPLRHGIDLQPGIYDAVIYRPWTTRYIAPSRVILKYEQHTAPQTWPWSTIFRFNGHPLMTYGQRAFVPFEFRVDDDKINELAPRSGRYLPTPGSLATAESVLRILRMPLSQHVTRRGIEGVQRS